MEKTCSRCGETYPHEFFPKARRVRSYAYTRTVCIGCEQTARDERKLENRWRTKARDSLNRHADRFIKAELWGITSRDDLVTRFGWDVDRMAHEAEHAYGNGCPYCGKRFLTMGHGFSDITLDVRDPEQPPFYATNTTWACATCNRAKGRKSPREYGAMLVAWARWRKRQARLAEDPWFGTLFEGSDLDI